MFVAQRIGTRQLGVEVEGAARILKIITAGNLAGGADAGHDFMRRNIGDHSAVRRAKGFLFQNGQAKPSSRRGAGAAGTGELGLRRGRVQVQHGHRGGGKRVGESADVVVVSVADDDGVGGREIDAEAAGVVWQRESLPGVEQHAVRARINPEREAVLPENTGAARGVFAEERDGDHGFEMMACSSNCAAVPTQSGQGASISLQRSAPMRARKAVFIASAWSGAITHAA